MELGRGELDADDNRSTDGSDAIDESAGDTGDGDPLLPRERRLSASPPPPREDHAPDAARRRENRRRNGAAARPPAPRSPPARVLDAAGGPTPDASAHRSVADEAGVSGEKTPRGKPATSPPSAAVGGKERGLTAETRATAVVPRCPFGSGSVPATDARSVDGTMAAAGGRAMDMVPGGAASPQTVWRGW